MGLDMYLYGSLYVGGEYRHDDSIIDIAEAKGMHCWNAISVPVSDISSISLKVGYWRKANAIHNWFVQNHGDGVDDCRPMSVSLDDLKELKGLCLEVLEDHGKAEELLPSAYGLFFGSTEYDEWYYYGLEETVKIIDKAILMYAKYNGLDFCYEASW